MNLLRNNLKTRTKLLFTTLLFQVLLVPNAFAIDVSINGSENLTLMDDIVFDYEASPRVIEFDIANPIVCSEPFEDTSASTVLNVNSALNGNEVLAANFDYSNFVFRVNTDADIQCATELGVHNDVVFGQGFESSGNNLQIVLKDLLTDEILNTGNTIDLHDGQAYQYKYEIKNTSPDPITADILENYLRNASPTFTRDAIDGWVCQVISGNFSSCGNSVSGGGFMSLENAVIGPFGELEVIATRRVSIETAGSNIKLDLLAAAFPTNVIDSNLNNNIAFTSFGTTTITATKLNVISNISNSVAGEQMSNVVVQMLDGDEIVDSNNNGLVNISISSSSPSGGTLSGDLQVNAINGIATFSGLSIDKANTGYSLRVSSIGLTSDETNVFSITPGSATNFAIITQPSESVAGTIISPAVVVEARDDFGNVDTNFGNILSVSIDPKTFPGVSLQGTVNSLATQGIITFDDLQIDTPNDGYKLQFVRTGFTTILSDLFNITATPSAANSVYGINPDSQIDGTLEQVAGNNVTILAGIRDANNNPVGSGVVVSFTIQNSMGANALDGECTTNSNGLCTLDISSTLVGVTTVSASISGSPITSLVNGFGDVNTWIAGDADAQMSNFGAAIATAGINTSVTLEAELRDQYGNLVNGESVIFGFENSNGASTPSNVNCSSSTDINGVCTSSVSSSGAGNTIVKAYFGDLGSLTEIINVNDYDDGQNILGKVIEWIVPD